MADKIWVCKRISNNGMSAVLAVLEAQVNLSVTKDPTLLKRTSATSYDKYSTTQAAMLSNTSVKPSPAPETAKYLFWVLLAVPVLAVFGNILVVTSVLIHRKLRNNHTNYYISSLATSDFFIGMVVMPFGVYQLVDGGHWTLGENICQVYLISDVACSTASIMNLVMISVDRFAAIMFPRSYQAKWRNPRRSLAIILVIWISSLLVAVPLLLQRSASYAQSESMSGLIQLNSSFISSNQSIPEIVCGFESHDFMIYSSLFSFYLPAMIVIPMYVAIYYKLKTRAQRKLTSAMQCSPSLRENAKHEKTVRINHRNRCSVKDRRKTLPWDHPSIKVGENDYLLGAQASPLIYLANQLKTNSDIQLRKNVDERLINWSTPNGNEGSQGNSNVTQITSIAGTSVNTSKLSSTTPEEETHEGSRATKIYLSPPRRCISQQEQMMWSDVNHDNSKNSSSQKTSPILKKRKQYGSPKISWTSYMFKNGRFGSLSVHSAIEGASEHSSCELNDEWADRCRKISMTERATQRLLSFRDIIAEGLKNRKRRENSMLRREQKATKLVAVVLVCFLLCWSPFFSFNLFRGICLKMRTCAVEDTDHFKVFVAVTWLGYTNSVLNPVLYTLFNNLYRNAFKRILTCNCNTR